MFGPEVTEYSIRGIIRDNRTSELYWAHHIPTDTPVAIKKFFLDKIQENASLLQQEILTTRQLQHPNILPYFCTFVSGLDLYIISPLMAYGSCRDLIDNYFNEGLPESASCIILKETLQGLEYIHNKGYIHRGIRASHILINSTGNVCLAGLRSAGSLLLQGKRQKSLHCLPPANHNNKSLIWLSPELLEQNLKGYDEKSDIYSIGMVACELANGAIPFSDIPTTLMLTEKVRGNTPQLLDCTTFPNVDYRNETEVPDSGVGDSASCSAVQVRQVYSTRKLSEVFHHFAELCLQKEPNLRPTTSQLLTHMFFKQIKKSDTLPQYLKGAQTIDSKSDFQMDFLLQDQFSEMSLESLCDWDF